jgi:hypothetical protein
MRTSEEVRAARKLFAREHDGRMAWQIAARLRDLFENARVRADAAPVQVGFGGSIDGEAAGRLSLPADPSHQLLDPLVRLYVLQSPGFAEWLTAKLNEAAPTFCTGMSQAEFDRTLQGFEDELTEVEREQRRRPLLEAQAQLDAELAALEQDA